MGRQSTGENRDLSRVFLRKAPTKGKTQCAANEKGFAQIAKLAGHFALVAAPSHLRQRSLGRLGSGFAKALKATEIADPQSSRTNAYQSWTAAKQRAALKQTACRRDALPAVGAVDLTSYPLGSRWHSLVRCSSLQSIPVRPSDLVGGLPRVV
jgi:hypothetical protein